MWTLLAVSALGADPAVTTWQSPPDTIAPLLDSRWAPSVRISPDRAWMLELDRPSLPPMAELAEPQVKVAGIKLNPNTNSPAREYGFTGITLRPQGAAKKVERTAVAVPDNARIRNVDWSFDGQRFSFTHTTADTVQLWVAERDSGESRMLAKGLNSAWGDPCDWLPGAQGLVCLMVDIERGAAPEADLVPAGPRIAENIQRKTPARTYQNLLETAHDEALFDHYLTARVVRVTLDGATTELLGPAVVDWVSPSPDGKWLLTKTIDRPYSTTVPASRFPATYTVHDLSGVTEPRILETLPLADDVPISYASVRTGKRSWAWRADAPATLWTVEALDGGDADSEAEHRDRLTTLAAPFDGEPTELWRSELRFGGVTWGSDTLALVEDWWWDTRQVRTHTIAPSEPGQPAKLLDDRSWQDRYADPGQPLTTPGTFGWCVLRTDAEGRLWMVGEGHTPDGQFPFLDALDTASGDTERLWQAVDPWLEEVVTAMPDGRFVTRRESSEEPPNYALRTPGRKKAVALTNFADWAPPFAKVRKEVIRYERQDGLPLSATVYFPPGHDPDVDGPLPALFWAYPSEFKSRADAGQVTATTKSFDRPWGSSHLYLLLEGRMVVDDPNIPIVGEGEQQPNDTYVDQLVSGAEAAATALTERGWADPDRLVIGGHSYGAFTAANLLAHSDLFAAGIARSGAYNRSLTPFGFQGEERSYWEAMDTYIAMSPFTHADKIDEPLLLIHGAEDSNSGTFPVQSERMYEALKGHGATVRWVELPYETHGYRSREAVGHTLWEMLQWVDAHAASDSAAAATP